MNIDFKLPVRVFRVGDTCFSSGQVEAMVNRTNGKLAKVGIEITIASRTDVPEKSFAYVYQTDPAKVGYDNHVKLLQNGAGLGANKLVRIFLVKADLDYRNDSWTYDPLSDSQDEDVWGGAIFITELINDNSDARYIDMGYRKTNDTLLHELGHVLMQEDNHYAGQQLNFFHEESEKTDDTIFDFQANRLRSSKYLISVKP